MGRYAFIILSNPPEDLSEAVRAAHALHYAAGGLKEEGGHDVVVYFDGLGSRIPIAQSPYKGGLRPAYEEAVRAGVIYGACGYCASPPPHLNIGDELRRAGLRLVGDEEHHEDISIFIDSGYQVLIF